MVKKKKKKKKKIGADGIAFIPRDSVSEAQIVIDDTGHCANMETTNILH